MSDEEKTPAERYGQTALTMLGMGVLSIVCAVTGGADPFIISVFAGMSASGLAILAFLYYWETRMTPYLTLFPTYHKIIIAVSNVITIGAFSLFAACAARQDVLDGLRDAHTHPASGMPSNWWSWEWGVNMAKYIIAYSAIMITMSARAEAKVALRKTEPLVEPTFDDNTANRLSGIMAIIAIKVAIASCYCLSDYPTSVPPPIGMAVLGVLFILLIGLIDDLRAVLAPHFTLLRIACLLIHCCTMVTMFGWKLGRVYGYVEWQGTSLSLARCIMVGSSMLLFLSSQFFISRKEHETKLAQQRAAALLLVEDEDEEEYEEEEEE